MEYLGEKLLEEYKDQDNTGYRVMPIRSVYPYRVQKYVRRLIAKRLHIPRFSEDDPMTEEEILDYFLSEDCDPDKYVGIHLETGDIVCEVTVNNYLHNSGRLHFSILSELSRKEKLMLGVIVPEAAVKYIQLGRPLESLVGLTPVLNQLACKFVLKTGFEKLGIIKGAAKYQNQICDAMLTTKDVRSL